MGRQLLMADRRGHPAHTAEAEPVVVTVDDQAVSFEMDDGETLTFTRAALDEALTPQKGEA